MAKIDIKINGKEYSETIDDNILLVDFLREKIGLTGTHVGCDTSQCGACVVHINGDSVKSCTTLAMQVNGKDITTIEGLSDGDNLHPIQKAFQNNHALQCGFCTPGLVMSAVDLLQKNKNPSEDEIREWFEGHI
ncbi:MAG: (2Fe-2S)-binding protein, partial [Rhizobiales bacterium]|nr:(2Fe-2S)-binding protein [Hyphomicrobiales bacterium]